MRAMLWIILISLFIYGIIMGLSGRTYIEEYGSGRTIKVIEKVF